MDGCEVTYDGESGTVYSLSKVSVFVPDDLGLSDEEAFHQARNTNLDTPDGVVRLDDQSSEGRSRSERAELLAVLYNQVGEFEFRFDDVTTDNPASSRIPIQVTVNGKTAIACYLAVHGLSNDQIADLLNVGSRTVSQYLSDLKKGER